MAQPQAQPPASPGRPAQPASSRLADADYETILGTCRGIGHSMERAPESFAGLDEERLRDHFLSALNGRFPGGATGETFNNLGKTDILVRRDDHNVFVGEAQIWDGPASLTKALNQILDYTTWRDTRTAVALFNRDRQISTVLDAIVPTVRAFQADASEIEYGHEGEFRFELHQRKDENLKLLVTIQLFDLPKVR